MSLEEIEQEFGELQEKLKTSCQDARDAAEAMIGQQLSDAAIKIREALDRVEGVVDEQLEKVKGLLESGEGVLASIEARMDQFETLIEETKETTNEWFEAVNHGIEDLESSHSSAIDMADEALESANSLIETVSEQIDLFCENVAAAFTTLADGAIEQIQEVVLQPVYDARDALLDSVQQMLDELIGDIFPAKLTEVTDVWIAEIRGKLGEMIGILQEQMEEFRTSLIEGSDTSAGQREAAKLMLDQLDAVLAPVMDSVGRISSLADSVGISFG